MPPKKGGDGIKPPPIIGRFGTSLKIGIVGLPNVGKSTFFNVLTNSQASAENFPFCTIDPNESRVPVPDERFDFLCQYHKPASKIPAFLNVVDIAGLVKGAHNGQGLGNAFLSHISACDGIFHLTRKRSGERRWSCSCSLVPEMKGQLYPPPSKQASCEAFFCIIGCQMKTMDCILL
uniref:Obg like ATPase 1 n=1 Tax=Oryctolagus cuniculus TaxID=9986 RepID=A0A5F9D5J2_RABIT